MIGLFSVGVVMDSNKLEWLWVYLCLFIVSSFTAGWFIYNRENYKRRILLILRDRRLNEELSQYKDSPYLSPLTAYYIGSLDRMYIYKEPNYLDEQFKKKFAHYLKRSILLKKKPLRLGPKMTKKFIYIVGSKIWVSFSINIIVPISLLSIFLASESLSFFSSWFFLCLPIIFAFFIRAVLLIQAIIELHPKNIEFIMKKNKEETHITWRYLKEKCHKQYGGKIQNKV